MAINISPSDAKNLFNNGSITQDTFEKIIGNQPAGPQAPEKNPGLLSKIAGLAKDVNPVSLIKSAGNTLNESGRFSTQDSAQTPTFDATQSQTQGTKSGLPGAQGEALRAAKQAAGTEEEILTPAGAKSAEQIYSQTELGRVNAQARTDQAWQQFQTDQQKARDTLDTISAKAKINPNRYLDEMGVTQKTFTAIALFFGGFSAGMGGGSNRAADFLDRQIKNDIDAQKNEIEKQVLLLARQSGLASADINAGQVSAISQNLSNQLVTTGSIAALEAIKNQVQGATASAKADALIFPLQQQLIDSQLKYDEVIKGIYGAQDYNTLSLIGKYLDNFGIIPKSQTPKNRINPSEFSIPPPFMKEAEKEVEEKQEKKTPEKKSFFDTVTQNLNKRGF